MEGKGKKKSKKKVLEPFKAENTKTQKVILELHIYIKKKQFEIHTVSLFIQGTDSFPIFSKAL